MDEGFGFMHDHITEDSLFRVTEAATRSVGRQDACFYCGRAIGNYHAIDCATVRRTVTVKATITYEIEAPSTWTPEDIEHHRNEGSWCSSNIVYEIQDLVGEGEEIERCICRMVKYEYVGETNKPLTCSE